MKWDTRSVVSRTGTVRRTSSVLVIDFALTRLLKPAFALTNSRVDNGSQIVNVANPVPVTQR